MSDAKETFKFEKPAVGTWVRVVTDYSDYKRNFHWLNQRKSESRGKVVESQDWEGENTFALLTTDRKMPIKTIELKRVAELEVIEAGALESLNNVEFKAAEAEAAEDIRVFEIKGSKGNPYVVTKNKFTWTCTCVAGQRGRRCKHVAEAQEILKKEKATA